MAETFTDKLKLSKRDTGDLNWGPSHNSNFDLLDAHAQQGTLRPPRTLLATLGSGAVGSELVGNTTYFYKITSINDAGETTESKIPFVLEAQVTQPGVPLPVLIQWEQAKGATGYRIYKSTASGQERFLAEILGESTQNYTDTGNISTNNSIPVPPINMAFTSVRRIIAGVGIALNPTHGTGDVTINLSGGGLSFPLLAPNSLTSAPPYSFATRTDMGMGHDGGSLQLIVDALIIAQFSNGEVSIEDGNSLSIQKAGDSSDPALNFGYGIGVWRQSGPAPYSLSFGIPNDTQSETSESLKLLFEAVHIQDAKLILASDYTPSMSFADSPHQGWVSAGGETGDIQWEFMIDQDNDGQTTFSTWGFGKTRTLLRNNILQLQSSTAPLRFMSTNFGNFVALKGPDTLTADTTWVLPDSDGSPGQVLSTNGSGLLSWINAGGGSFPLLAPGGATPQFSWFAKANTGLAEIATNQHGWKANDQWVWYTDGETPDEPWLRFTDITQIRIGDGFNTRLTIGFYGGAGNFDDGFYFDETGNAQGPAVVTAIDGERVFGVNANGVTFTNPDAPTFYVGMQASVLAAASYVLVLPIDAGSSGQLLSTDGAGLLSWVNPGGVNFPLISPDGAGFGYAFANGGANDVKMYFDQSANQIFFDIAGGQVQIAAAGEFDIYANGNNTSVELKENTHEIIFTSQSGQIFAIYGTWIQLNTEGRLRFADGNNWVEFKQGAGMTGQTTYELPPTDGSSGQVLQTNGSGILSWASSPTPSFITAPNAQSYGYTANGLTVLTMDGSVLDYQSSGNPGPFVQLDTWASLQLPNEFLGQGQRLPFAFAGQTNDYLTGFKFDSSTNRFVVVVGGNPVMSMSDNTIFPNSLGSSSEPVNSAYFSNIYLNNSLTIPGVTIDDQNPQGVDLNGSTLILDLDSNVKIGAEYPSGKLYFYNGSNTPDENNWHVRVNFNNSSFDLSNSYKLAWFDGGGQEQSTVNGTGGDFEFRTQSGFVVRDLSNNTRFALSMGQGNLVVSDDGSSSNLGQWEFRVNQGDGIANLVIMQNQVVPTNWNGTGLILARDGNSHFDIVARSSSSVYFTARDYFAAGQGDNRDPAMYFNIISGGNAGISHFDYLIDGNIRLNIRDTEFIATSSSGSEFKLDDANTMARIAVPTGYVIDMKVATESAAEFDESTTADTLRCLLWDVTAGTLKRVKRGAIDSGGTGLRALAIDN